MHIHIHVHAHTPPTFAHCAPLSLPNQKEKEKIRQREGSLQDNWIHGDGIKKEKKMMQRGVSTRKGNALSTNGKTNKTTGDLTRKGNTWSSKEKGEKLTLRGHVTRRGNTWRFKKKKRNNDSERGVNEIRKYMSYIHIHESCDI